MGNQKGDLEIKKILDEYNKDVKRHFDVALESVKDDVKIIAEQYGDIRKDIGSIKETLDSHTETLAAHTETLASHTESAKRGSAKRGSGTLFFSKSSINIFAMLDGEYRENRIKGVRYAP